MDELVPIDKRTKQFAIRIVKLYKYLVEERGERVLSKQLLRSGTSIGANVAEGLFGASRADFVNKYMRIHHCDFGGVCEDGERRKMNSTLFHFSLFLFTSLALPPTKS